MLELYIVMHACMAAISTTCDQFYLRVDTDGRGPVGPAAFELQCQLSSWGTGDKWLRDNRPQWTLKRLTCAYVDPAKIEKGV